MRYLKSFLEFIFESDENKNSYNNRGLYSELDGWKIKYSDYKTSQVNHDIIDKFEERCNNVSDDLKSDINNYTERVIDFFKNNYINSNEFCLDFDDVKIICEVSYSKSNIKIKTYLNSNMKPKRNTKYIKIK